MEAAKKDKIDSAAVDMTLTHSNRELLERKSQKISHRKTKTSVERIFEYTKLALEQG